MRPQVVAGCPGVVGPIPLPVWMGIRNGAYPAPFDLVNLLSR